MKPLSDAVTEYLALRRALGFKLRAESRLLPDFASFLRRQGSSVITTDLALRWAQQPRDASPLRWAKRLGAIRQFARHHRAFDPRTEIPPADLISDRSQRRTPHIYTTDEITALMGEARRLKHPLVAASYATILGLLAATGMRISEVFALDCDDVDWRQELLTVRGAKFGKSRQVPLQRSTITALRESAVRREHLRPRRRSSSFFISNAGTRIFYQSFHEVFLRLLQRTGLDRRGGQRPRIHDLRHSFAVRTLCAWYRTGVDVERRLPWLSTYLGHVSPSTTYWYLTATPELLALAVERAARALKVRP